jgi:hypothetical protein
MEGKERAAQQARGRPSRGQRMITVEGRELRAAEELVKHGHNVQLARREAGRKDMKGAAGVSAARKLGMRTRKVPVGVPCRLDAHSSIPP